MALTEAGLRTALLSAWHIHQCVNRDCRRVYECTMARLLQCDGHTDLECDWCRKTSVPIWVESRLPQDCCRRNPRQIHDRDERRIYRMAGDHPWYRCRVCGRSNGWPEGAPWQEAS